MKHKSLVAPFLHPSLQAVSFPKHSATAIGHAYGGVAGTWLYIGEKCESPWTEVKKTTGVFVLYCPFFLLLKSFELPGIYNPMT